MSAKLDTFCGPGKFGAELLKRVIMLGNAADWEILKEFDQDRLPPLAGGWIRQIYTIGGQRFELIRPANPDALLDTESTLEAHARDGYMPYWGYLWPTSLDMGRFILDSDLPKGLPTLEIGAGIGLAGLAGLAKGLDVTFSDYDRLSVRLALTNARLNHFPDANGILLDWRSPPAGSFPLILGCDVIYEIGNHALVLDVLDAMLSVDGQCWLADPQRHTSGQFVSLAQQKGYQVEHRQVVREAFPTRPDGITDVWILRHPN